MKKVVLKLDVHDGKDKQKAMKAVSGLPGVDSISMDMKDRKLTVIGDVDPIDVVGKLRKQKQWYTEILTVGPAKEEKKDDKKDDKKDGGAKKDEGGSGGDKKGKDDNKSKESDQIAKLVEAYKAYNPHMTMHYRVVSAEENPNSCIIC